jgi:DNA-binding NtrC family response regulator
MSDQAPTTRQQVLSVRRQVEAWRLEVGGVAREVRVGEVLRCGSNPGNDLVLTQDTVSRIHAELSATPKGVRVRDLGSTNGSSINDVPVVDAIARPGMTISLGQARLTVGAAASPALEPLSPHDHFGPVVGRSEPMRALFKTLTSVAQTSTTVLLQAESGCGKELIANALHEASPRKGGPYVVFDCAGIAPSLVESALFGHEKGAFTGAVARRAGCFEEASGGTLFIDEVGELPLELQPRLLRALESRQVRRVGGSEPINVDVRVIAATHRDLPRMVNSGQFREDLYYRLAVVRLRLPPLRERLEDIPLLVERLLVRALDGDVARAEAVMAAMPPEQWERLRRYRWPGNVRELRNAIERSLALSATPSVEPPSLGELARPRASADGEPNVSLERPFIEQRDALVERFEATYLKGMLDKHEGNLSRAAANAGMDRMYFKRRLARHGLLPKPDER